MSFFKRTVLAALGAIILTALPGCESLTGVKEENQQLREIILKQEDENRKLMAELEALRSRPEGIDPAELEAREIEINKREKQLAVLRSALRQMQGQVALSERIESQLESLAEELGGELVGNKLVLPMDYYFKSGQYTLMPDGKKKLTRFAQVLKDYRLQLMIVGHTDNVPIKHLRKKGITSNRLLSLYRAMAVLNQLEQAGYDKNLMYPTGWGELKPLYPNDSAKNRQLNRRVEIYVDPSGSGLLNASAITDVEPTYAPVSVSETNIYSDGNLQETTIISEGGPVIATE